MLLKDLPKPLMPNRTYMSENHFFFRKYVGDFVGPTPHEFTWDLVLLKDLSKTTNTDQCFHAQNSREKRGWVNKIYNVVNNEIMAINNFKA